MTAADRPYGEFYGFYSVSPENFGSTHVYTRSDTKKERLNPIAREPRVGGEREKQMAIEHVLTCHSVTRLSSIALLSTSGRIFKYRHVLLLSWKMSDCKSE